jgi:hypothetical protein
LTTEITDKLQRGDVQAIVLVILQVSDFKALSLCISPISRAGRALLAAMLLATG